MMKVGLNFSVVLAWSENWNGTITMVSGYIREKKLKFDDVCDLIFCEETCMEELSLVLESVLNTINRSKSV